MPPTMMGVAARDKIHQIKPRQMLSVRWTENILGRDRRRIRASKLCTRP